MRLVVDANVVMSALIANSKTRELIVTIEPSLLTPEVVHDELEAYESLLVEKSGMDSGRLRQFLALLFEHIETVPVRDFYEHIELADSAIGDVDADDVLYLACALGYEADIWSDDSDLREQELVDVFSTNEVVDSFEVY